jgi:hypothetical protein
MTGTEELIESLVASASPVRRLPSPWVQAGCWFGFGLALIGALLLLLGPRPDIVARLARPGFRLAVAASLATGALAALAAMMAGRPDRARWWLAAPLPAAVLWLSTIGYGCLTRWVTMPLNGPSRGEVLDCFMTLLAASVPLSVVMYWMLRAAARVRPRGPILSGGLAVAALTATALSLLHPFDASLMIVLWNFGAAVLVIGANALAARVLLADGVGAAPKPGRLRTTNSRHRSRTYPRYDSATPDS